VFLKNMTPEDRLEGRANTPPHPVLRGTSSGGFQFNMVVGGGSQRGRWWNLFWSAVTIGRGKEADMRMPFVARGGRTVGRGWSSCLE